MGTGRIGGILVSTAVILTMIGVLAEPREAAAQRDGGARRLAGDFNGDFYADLVIGVPWEDVELTNPPIQLPNAGAVHVIYGGPNGVSAFDSLPDQFFTQNSLALVGPGAAAHNRFGAALAIGNINGDQFWFQEQLGIDELAEPGDFFGFALPAAPLKSTP